jgi:hypothetical protein
MTLAVILRDFLCLRLILPVSVALIFLLSTPFLLLDSCVRDVHKYPTKLYSQEDRTLSFCLLFFPLNSSDFSLKSSCLQDGSSLTSSILAFDPLLPAFRAFCPSHDHPLALSHYPSLELTRSPAVNRPTFSGVIATRRRTFATRDRHLFPLWPVQTFFRACKPFPPPNAHILL